jgi:hypothetical protein
LVVRNEYGALFDDEAGDEDEEEIADEVDEVEQNSRPALPLSSRKPVNWRPARSIYVSARCAASHMRPPTAVFLALT